MCAVIKNGYFSLCKIARKIKVVFFFSPTETMRKTTRPPQRPIRRYKRQVPQTTRTYPGPTDPCWTNVLFAFLFMMTNMIWVLFCTVLPGDSDVRRRICSTRTHLLIHSSYASKFAVQTPTCCTCTRTHTQAALSNSGRISCFALLAASDAPNPLLE